jgi:hypothetical protein
MACCDASICSVDTLCDDGQPVTLVPGDGGGTWSSLAPRFNVGTGEFDPNIAVAGTYTFYYTLACGMDSTKIEVISCPTLSMCVLPNGDLQVTGGILPYTLYEGTIVGSCEFGPDTGCNFLTHEVTYTLEQFASRAIATPPPGADTVQVNDPVISFTSWNIATLNTCPVCPGTIITYPPYSLGTIVCGGTIPSAATNEAEFEALVSPANIDDNFCGTLLISHNDVYSQPADICGVQMMERTYTISDDNTSGTCIQTLTI